MKAVAQTLCATAIVFSLVACTEQDPKETGTDAPGVSSALTNVEDHSDHTPPPAPAFAEATPGDGTVYAGVYTSAQADRGKANQDTNCMACHTLEDWGGGRFLTSQTGQNMAGLVEHIRSTMPFDEPGRLEYEQYVDIAARILQLNRIPAGTSELPADPGALASIRVEYRR
jgi:hypothetical protein